MDSKYEIYALDVLFDICISFVTINGASFHSRYHRGIIVSWLNDPSQEFEFTAEILRKDAKNYHAWQHRQAIVNGFQMWDSEIAFVTSLLEDDLRNNSAWNHRYYTVLNTTGFTDDVAEKELK